MSSNINYQSLVELITSEISQKNILAWSKDPVVQEFYENAGVAGRVDDKGGNDYLSIITTNIGGNKSDLYMESTAHHSTYIQNNGEVKNSLTYTRSHRWTPAQRLVWKEILKPFEGT